MGSVTRGELISHMGIPDPDPGTPDDEHLARVVAAINATVPRTVPRVRTAAPADPWPGDVQEGAVMLGARLFARRNSATGVAAYTETGPAYVARYDPDLERLFGVGSWAPPQAR